MQKNIIYETDSERNRRLRCEAVRREYIERSNVILSGEYKPNRIMSIISKKYGLTIMGVKKILKKDGIYKDALHPVIFSGKGTPTQLSLEL